MNSLSMKLDDLRPIALTWSRRKRLELVIGMLVTALDLMDGDSDVEDDTEDRCEVHDDDPTYTDYSPGAGDADDAEAEPDDEEDVGSDGA